MISPALHEEQIFRLVLIAGLITLCPVGIYHRLRSQASGERLDRRQEGLFILLTLRPLGLAAMLGLLAYAINPASMGWSQVGVPSWLRWCGVGIGVPAGILLTCVFRNLGPNLTDTVVTRERHTLVTTGPYRWVRHPFYVASALALMVNSLVTANWFIALTGSLTVALLVVRTQTEEAKLVERFGGEYRDYMARTGRFWPSFTKREVER